MYLAILQNYHVNSVDFTTIHYAINILIFCLKAEIKTTKKKNVSPDVVTLYTSITNLRVILLLICIQAKIL